MLTTWGSVVATPVCEAKEAVSNLFCLKEACSRQSHRVLNGQSARGNEHDSVSKKKIPHTGCYQKYF